MTGLRARADVQGAADPAFENVRQVFAENFDKGLEVGAAFAAYHRGHKVVDLWGGVADQRSGRPWAEDTMVLVFSTTKAATALCAHILVARGLLDVDAPVATYWPEFAQAGKETLPVRDLLSHQAGLAWIDTPLTIEETCAWDPVVAALAAQAPAWVPGTDHGYHATTFGWLVGEVVRRIDGRSLGRFFAEEVAGPLGLDFYIGLPERQEPRVSPVIPFAIPDLTARAEPGGATAPSAPAPAAPSEGGFGAIAQIMGTDAPIVKALSSPPGAFSDFGVFNSRALRAAEIPAANGVTDARSLARMYAGMVGAVDGHRVLGDRALRDAIVQRTSGPDRVLLDLDLQWGLGFMRPSSLIRLGEAAGATNGFGHFGAGGSAGWGDPDAELAFGYVMNRMDMGLAGDLRSSALIDATYEAAGALGG